MPVNHESKRIHRFYDIICLLSSLSITRGSRIKQKYSVEQDGCSIAKFRRKFADALAYICAYDKTAESVTAIALGRREKKVTIWIAANGKVKEKVTKFLNKILKMLDDIVNLPCASSFNLMIESKLGVKFCEILSSILDFNEKRNYKYYESFLSQWTSVCKSEEPSGETSKLQ